MFKIRFSLLSVLCFVLAAFGAGFNIANIQTRSALKLANNAVADVASINESFQRMKRTAQHNEDLFWESQKQAWLILYQDGRLSKTDYDQWIRKAEEARQSR